MSEYVKVILMENDKEEVARMQEEYPDDIIVCCHRQVGSPQIVKAKKVGRYVEKYKSSSHAYHMELPDSIGGNPLNGY